jgi:DNA-binding IclR family transcriptional regulator
MVSRTGTAGRSVVSKAAEILLSCLDGSSYSLTEIVDRTGLPRSTAHRLIRELVAWRLLERTAEGDYRTGLPLRLICTRDASVRFDIQECASPILQDLCQILHVEVRLGILNDCNVAYIEELPDGRSITAFDFAASLPAHATAMGKALLAFSPTDVSESIIAQGLPSYTPFTLTAPDRLRRALTKTRNSHLAISRWELQYRRSALAVPVYAPTGGVIAAIEVRVDDPVKELAVVRPALLTAGHSLTRELCTHPSPFPSARGVTV